MLSHHYTVVVQFQTSGLQPRVLVRAFVIARVDSYYCAHNMHVIQQKRLQYITLLVFESAVSK